MNEEMFYGTLPQDTQDFGQVLQGIRRNIGQFGRAAQYLPYDILGGPVDLATLAMRPFGYQTQTPVGGSDWLINLARQMGVADKPTGSGAELAGRMAFGAVSPVAATRGLTQVGRFVDMLRETPPVGSVNFTPQEVQAAQQAAQAITQPKRSDIGFYSKLEEATIPLQNKGTGQQYLAQIEKTAGVKPEEIQWTGLDTFLQGRKSVTKDEVLNYLDQNRVDVQEVRLDNRARELFDRARFDMEDRFEEMDSLLPKNIKDLDYYNLRDFWARGAASGNPEDIQKIQSLNLSPEAQNAVLSYGRAANESAIAKRSLEAGETTKFSSYTLPGGENYREILLTLPEGSKSPAYKAQKSLDDANKAYDADQSYENYQRVLRAREEADKVGADWKSPEFRSSHFDQPNILAHMRVNDRVVDGKKTLFIEEIQSDWHQAGRKKGYVTGEKAELPEGTKVFEPGAVDSPGQTNQAFTVQIPKAVNGRSLFYGTTREEALANAQSFIAQPSLGAVPDAPFKTSWHELSLKRAIQEASEKGYEKIAFTTGKTQAERYDLSKQVDYIDYIKEGPDQYRLAIVGKNGQGIDLPQETFSSSELENFVGKEVAERIAKGEGQTGGGRTTLRGPDLQVGGEGMKGFYDNILPKSLDKLGKKFGAKVTKSKIQTEAKGRSFEEELQNSEFAAEWPTATPERRSEIIDAITARQKQNEVEVWTMDITPQMRESVTTKGQPLFQFAPAIPAGGLLGQDEE